MDPDSTGQLIAIIVFLVLSAFFTAAEAALTSINKTRLKSLMEQGSKTAKEIGKLVDKPDKLLSSLMVGGILIYIALGSTTAVFAISLTKNSGIGPGPVLFISIILITTVVLMFVKTLPAAIAGKNPDRSASAVVPFVRIIVFFLTPFSALLNAFIGLFAKLIGTSVIKNSGLTETEIMSMVDTSHKEGVIETEEKIMITNVFEFGDNLAKDIMTPRTDIVSISSDSSRAEIMELFRTERYSRVLVYDEDIDNIIGMLFFKDFVFSDMQENEFDVSKLLRPAFFSYENKPISKLFSEMQSQGIPIAVILDEYSGTSGIVTIEDLVEEIVGDISDEDDEDEKVFEKVGDSEYIVDGSMKIDDFNEMADTSFESEDYESIGGYLLGIFGHIPKEGETYAEGGISFSVEEMDKNRIDKLRVTINRADVTPA